LFFLGFREKREDEECGVFRSELNFPAVPGAFLECGNLLALWFFEKNRTPKRCPIGGIGVALSDVYGYTRN